MKFAHNANRIWYNDNAMSRKGNVNILVAENIYMKTARDIIAGVMRYAATKPGWNVFVHGGHPLDRDDGEIHSRGDCRSSNGAGQVASIENDPSIARYRSTVRIPIPRQLPQCNWAQPARLA